jgi:hypothetical protein
MSTAEKAAVASAIASAVAAVAAWAAVRQAGRWQRRQLEPLLNIQVSEVIDVGFIRIRVENTGGGFAREARLWVRQDPYACYTGVPPHGSVGPGAGVTLSTTMPPTKADVQGVVICRYGPRLFAWDVVGRHKRWRFNRWALWQPSSDANAVRRFYADTRRSRRFSSSATPTHRGLAVIRSARACLGVRKLKECVEFRHLELAPRPE